MAPALVVTIEVKGVTEAAVKLNMEPVQVILPALHRGALRIEHDMKLYPEPPPDSRYIRTFVLRKQWTTAPMTGGGKYFAGYRVGTATVYAPWVQSHLFQATVHRGRWPTDKQVASRNQPALVRDVNITVRQALAR